MVLSIHTKIKGEKHYIFWQHSITKSNAKTNNGCIIAKFQFGWGGLPIVFSFIHLAADDPGLDMLLEDEPW